MGKLPCGGFFNATVNVVSVDVDAGTTIVAFGETCVWTGAYLSGCFYLPQ